METPDKTIKYNLFDYAYYVGRKLHTPLVGWEFSGYLSSYDGHRASLTELL